MSEMLQRICLLKWSQYFLVWLLLGFFLITPSQNLSDSPLREYVYQYWVTFTILFLMIKSEVTLQMEYGTSTKDTRRMESCTWRLCPWTRSGLEILTPSSISSTDRMSRDVWTPKWWSLLSQPEEWRDQRCPESSWVLQISGINNGDSPSELLETLALERQVYLDEDRRYHH